MEIQILSDLHLEAPKGYDVFEITPTAPYLALLGDIGNTAHKGEFRAFLTQQLKQFRAVFLVPGNHEPYHSTWPDSLAFFTSFREDAEKDLSLGKFILLDRANFHIPDTNTVILGCSLFSHVPAASQMNVEMGLNDFFHSGDEWTIQEHNKAHDRGLTWLNEQVTFFEKEHPGMNLVIFSHWSPTRDPRAADPKQVNSKITSGFSTDLSMEPCFKSPAVKLWAFGHTHWNCDFVVERAAGAAPLRLVTNQRGYYFAQAEGFDIGKTVAVG